MSEFDRVDMTTTDDGLRQYIMGVFAQMSTGLAITAVVAYVCYRNLISGGILYTMLVNYYLPFMLGSMIIELFLCIRLSRNLYTMSNKSARASFYLYALITGVTFSVLPLSFGEATVFTAFIFAAVLFVSCLIIGHTTKVDLTKFGNLLIAALFAMVIATFMSFVIPGLMNNILWSYVGVVLFLGLTAWDMQRLKQFYYGSYQYGSEVSENMAVFGAFQLYLDFINLFLYVLRILGSRRRN